nr:ribonuclease H-like domain-containing protein [Tanacetum cinerariifolium]
MSSLFADTHNVIAILEKSAAAEGFEQIIDFPSGSYIHYALTVNPHIYISCIKQFWNTASVKRSGDVTRLQALVDEKKIMISEVVTREILQFDDAEGVVCLPNEEIFAGLAQMGYEKLSTKLKFYKAFFSSQWKFLIHTILQSLSAKWTSWNEFSTTMASAVICLSKAGSESLPPMLNKENYAPWSSRLLRYAKSRPNGKLIHNSILNGPYVRKMIPEPGDANREITVTETFHLQTDDELSDKELKQIEVDDQAIQTILLGLPEDIYAVIDICETAQEIWLRVQQMMKGSDIGIQKKMAKLFNEWERSHNSNEYGTRINGKSIQAKLLNTNQQQSENFVKPKEQADCLTGYEYGSRQTNADGWRVQNVGNQNGLIGVQGDGNQTRCYNCKGVGIQLQAEEYDLIAAVADLDEIEEVNANCILMANLQQASTSGTQTDSAPVYDTDGS